MNKKTEEEIFIQKTVITDTKIKTYRNILLFLLGFLALGAIFGGGAMLFSPSGELLGMPLSMIKNSPFNSFLIPGIILFVALGLAPTLLIYALIYKPKSKLAGRINFFSDMHWSWSFSIYIAFALIVWIQIEMVFLNAVHWAHTFYMFYALAIIFFALLPPVRNLYKNHT
jgi:hypothetical protein